MAAERFSTKEHASVQIYGKPGNVIAVVKNLSSTGACLEWAQEDCAIQEGDLLRLTVILKALNRRHNVSAEVVWRRGNLSGISFIKHDQVLEKMMERS